MTAPATPRSESRHIAPASPATPTHGDERGAPLLGTGLCLSGGGYRAMLFHLGALWRLNELGLLRSLQRVASVSGGSITAAVLGHRWRRLAFNRDEVATNFEPLIAAPVRALARRTIDVPAVLLGCLLPGSTIADRMAAAYRRHLFGRDTLQDLPAEGEGPRFVINATSLQSGALFRFSRANMADWRVGRIDAPRVELARAVAASAAFPPFLSPAVFRVAPGSFVSHSGAELQREPYTERTVLADGGVYDNMAIETVWKRCRTVLVSDAGAALAPEARPRRFWPAQMVRVVEVIDNQVRALRKRQLIEAFRNREREGAYWGIRTDLADYGLPDAMPVPWQRSLELASVPTRLAALPETLQARLVNWGYAVSDAALRRHVIVRSDLRPPVFPYPGGV